MMNSSPDGVRTSTQEQFPPYRIVLGPGDGIEPRVPQNRIFMSPSTSASPGCRRILLYKGLAARCQNPRDRLEAVLSIQRRMATSPGLQRCSAHPVRAARVSTMQLLRRLDASIRTASVSEPDPTPSPVRGAPPARWRRAHGVTAYRSSTRPISG